MNYRTTRIYRRSLELVDFVAGLRMPTGCGFLGDQLRRAAASVALNYLEGCGRNGEADRRRMFHIAIGSAQEVAAAVEVAHRLGGVTVEDLARGQDLCDHVVAMLRRFR